MWISSYRTSNKFICICCIERELQEQGVCRVPLTLGKALKSLNKGFAECHPQQTWHNNQSDGKELSTDCYFLGIRQRLCRLLSWLLTKKKVGGRAAKWRWRRLYQVPWWLGTRQSLNVFAECNKIHPTNSLLCRVPLTDTRQSSDVRYWVRCSAGTCLFFAKCIYLSSITFLPSVFCPALSKLDILPSAFFCGAFYFFYTQQICCLLSAP